MSADIKTAWYVTITDHVGYSLYSPRVLMQKVAEYGNRITMVEQVTTRWYGEHSDDTRCFTTLARVDITSDILRTEGWQ